ncbi:MAG TPA: LacI family DNA-binding transcriptional regulator [Tepidisphaeraceae bacterium]|jgi:LacI family transcriptional regulator|nr:LacI family DNA-binding transcriptional regulator [Tepidisphaeraceae bacterium]
MAVTLADIAARSGLSTFTVSNVLGTRPHLFKPETRERVWAAARELGYRPNSAAKAIATGRFNCISLLMSPMPNRSSLNSEAMRGVHDVVAERGNHLNITWLPDELLTSSTFIPKILKETMADGLLINYFQEIPKALVGLVDVNRIPSIWINSKQGGDCVCPADVAGAEMATRRFIEQGHRDIVLLDCSTSTHYSAVDRATGYANAMTSASLKPRLVRAAETVPLPDRTAYIRAWLAREPVPTAILCYSETSAHPLMMALCAQGLRVPQDVSVMTFHYSPADSTGIAIDTVIVPDVEVARRGAQMLMKKIEEPKVRLPEQTVSCGFAEGVTCAPPRADR